MVEIEITFWKNWYQRHVTKLKGKLINDFKDDLEKLIFKDERVYVGGNPKPFAIKINGELVYSKLEPVNGENSPQLDDEHYGRLLEKISGTLSPQ